MIVVGPMADATTEHIVEARNVAAQLRSYGATVREVYSPNATWSRVTEASRAPTFRLPRAGRGHPGPYGEFKARTMDGWPERGARRWPSQPATLRGVLRPPLLRLRRVPS